MCVSNKDRQLNLGGIHTNVTFQHENYFKCLFFFLPALWSPPAWKCGCESLVHSRKLEHFLWISCTFRMNRDFRITQNDFILIRTHFVDYVWLCGNCILIFYDYAIIWFSIQFRFMAMAKRVKWIQILFEHISAWNWSTAHLRTK